ncbi:MAG: motility associated factor glycosyltransferase family protein [Deltaproteobacteria bacterium]|nr:motility associated factor glycosyltransferase family protein [Deltaproteobacteria bacterium]
MAEPSAPGVNDAPGSGPTAYFDHGLFRRNLDALVAADIVTADHLRALAPPDDDVRLVPTRSGQDSVVASGRWLCSRYEPRREAETAIGQYRAGISGDIAPICAVFGSAGGYLARAALDAGFEQVYVYEPDARVLSATLGTNDFVESARSGRIRFTTRLDKFYFQMNFRERMEPNLAVIPAPAYPKAYPEAYADFQARINTLVNDSFLLSQTMLVKMGTWFDYAVRNFPTYARSAGVARLFDRFGGIPAVIVAAGPSLDHNITHLAAHRDRVLVIAVGTALKKLDRLGIVADFAVALESNDIRFQFEGVEFLPKTFGVLNLNSFPALWELPFRAKFGYTGRPASFGWLTEAVERKGDEIAVGGSVATTAFSFAAHLGCDPVILVGQDLAFSPDGAMHATGVGALPGQDVPDAVRESLNDDEELSRRGFSWIPGWHGERVLTRANFRNYLMWFEKNVSAVTSLGRTAYNCTEGGAHIAGFVHRPLADVLATLPTLDANLTDRIASLAAAKSFDEEAFLGRLGHAIERTRDLLKASTDLLAVLEKTSSRLKKPAKRVGAIEAALAACERADRVALPVARELDALLTPLCNTSLLLTNTVFEYDGLSRENQAIMNLKQTAALYKGFEVGATRLLAGLETLRERM